jgi:hypothetical protein
VHTVPLKDDIYEFFYEQPGYIYNHQKKRYPKSQTDDHEACIAVFIYKRIEEIVYEHGRYICKHYFRQSYWMTHKSSFIVDSLLGIVYHTQQN